MEPSPKEKMESSPPKKRESSPITLCIMCGRFRFERSLKRKVSELGASGPSGSQIDSESGSKVPRGGCQCYVDVKELSAVREDTKPLLLSAVREDTGPLRLSDVREDTRALGYANDEELLNMLDEYHDGEEISKETLQKLRKYIAEVEDSKGFEINTWPGSFFGVTSIIPAELSKEDKPEEYSKYERLAKFAMEEYNKNNQAEFVFEDLVRANVHPQIYTRCYLTFSARDVRVQNATPETFQAVVVVYMGPGDKDISISFCRPKLRI